MQAHNDKEKLSWMSAVSSQLSAQRQRWPLFAPVALGIGIAAYFALPVEPLLWPGVLAAGVCAGLWWVSRRHNLAWLVVLLFLVALGFTTAAWRTASLDVPVLHEPLEFTELTGTIDDIDLKEDEGMRLLIVAPEIAKAPELKLKRVRVSLRKADTSLKIGDRVRVKAMLFPLPSPTMPGAFDFGRYLFFQSVGASGFAVGEANVVQPAELGGFALWIKQTRIQLAADMMKQMGEKEGAVAAALTVGEQSAVPEATNEAMRASGLYHILSISGLHLALAAGIVFFFVRFLLNLVQPLALRINTKKVAAVAALASAFFYLLMAGEPVPAQRSFIMVAFVLLAVLVDRKGISMVSLAWAAGLILLLQPESLVGASFQMSFAATLAIVALYEVYGAKLAPTENGIMRRVWLFIAAAALTSLVATLATAPFVIHHFNRLQPWGMFANVLVSPLVSFLIMPAVILVFLLNPLGLQWIAYALLKIGIAGMLWVAEKAAVLPFASIALPSLSQWGFVLAALGLIWFCVWQTPIKRFGLVLLATGLFTTLLHQPFDVLMSDDAKQVAVRDAGGDWVMVKGTGRSFVAESWLKANGQEEPIKAPKGKWGEGISLKCDDAHCVYTKTGKSVLWLASYKTIAPYCDKAYDAVLASFYLREGECAETPLKIDKASLKQDGAIALRLSKEAVEIETAKKQLGARPWVP